MLGTPASEPSLARQSEVEETLKRISSHKGVIGTVIVNNDGVPIRSNLERSEQTAQVRTSLRP